ncbi:unnamed protein product [Coregonus sp. 'balchen']|nr:unnamed protein product [Coregonus sp. 'balchen']
MRNWLILHVLAACCFELIAGDDITSSSHEVMKPEGESVTLSCSYDTSQTEPWLYWYRHYPNQAPQFLLYKGARSSTSEHIPDKRYTSKTSYSSTELIIQHLTLADTALYYCALDSTQAEENVTQPTEDVMVLEGQPTTLTYLFDTTDQSPYLFWYKQQANSNPMFMLRRDTFLPGDTTTEFKERFHARLNVTAKSVPLTIQRVQMSDSAVYYCALKPTVTTGYTAPLQKHCVHVGGSHGNDITPTTDKVFGLEGDVINLSCNYSSASNLQWYRQDPGSSPIFLLLTGVTSNPSVVNGTPPYPRLSVKLNKERTRVDLDISSSEYCALQPIVTGNPETLYKNLTAHDKLLFQQTIQSNQHEVYGEEGSNVQLSCNYSSLYSVLWYKQYTGSAPQFLLFIHHASRTVVRAKPPYPHLTDILNKEKTRVDLEISSGEVTDSALYYCAVKPTLVYLVCVRMSLILLFLLSVFVADSMEQETITPLKPEVNVLQGTDLTLSCNYKGNIYNLQWYRQYPGSRPECLILILPTNKHVQNTSITTPRHTGRLNEEKTRVDLKISSAILEDSALYYCALQPTVTGNPDTLYKNLSRALGINSALVETLYEEEIISATTEEHVFEGDGVTLSCNYTGTYSGSGTLLLYQQYPRSTTEFLILITEGGFKTHLTTYSIL